MGATTTLVIGGTGKTGRRVAERLKDRNVPVRIGSRSGEPPFSWDDPAGWPAALNGVGAVYVTYFPDLAAPGSPDAIRTLTDVALKSGKPHIVLLSGRNEEEAQVCERIVQESGLPWTIVRASWFAQNFSEGYFVEQILAGEVALPAGDVREPFIDADDIADIAVAALTDEKHRGQLYEVTGPRLLTFADAVAEIGRATGRVISYVQIPVEDYAAALRQYEVPEDIVSVVSYLFREVLDGRSASVTDGVTRALGRPPRDFSEYVRDTAATGVWNPPATG